jgi:hypothetical protein
MPALGITCAPRTAVETSIRHAIPPDHGFARSRGSRSRAAIAFNRPTPATIDPRAILTTPGSPSPWLHAGWATVVLDRVRHRHLREIEREGFRVGGDRCAGRGGDDDDGDGVLGEREHDGLLDLVDSGQRLDRQSRYEQTATRTSGGLPML